VGGVQSQSGRLLDVVAEPYNTEAELYNGFVTNAKEWRVPSTYQVLTAEPVKTIHCGK
jgi:hypothetical protein